jgi:polyisoprenoid-binding protein YceI
MRKNTNLLGDLTIKGVTKPITLDVEFAGTVKDPWGNTRAGFELHGTVDRRDFGITWSKTLDSGGLMVGNDVEITCHVELIKPKA